MNSSAAGFDSSVLERRLGLPPGALDQQTGLAGNAPLLKATLGVSVRTLDFDSFKKNYLSSLPISIRETGGIPKKRLYKAAHLAKQLEARAPSAIGGLLKALAGSIDRIDVYCFYSRRDYIAVYGNSRVERISPNEFVDLTQNAFPHVCAWSYLTSYQYDSKQDRLMLDYFRGKITPAWETLENAKCNIQAYYSGAECNPLVSIADLALRLIETYQVGTINDASLLKTIEDRIPDLSPKLRFHNLGGPGFCLKAAAPTLPLDLNAGPYIRHPLYLIAWNPPQPRDMIKPAFEWSPVYNAAMDLACHTDGNVKFLEFEKDHLYWDISKDTIIAWTAQDLQHLELLKDMGHQLPKVMTKDELLTAVTKIK